MAKSWKNILRKIDDGPVEKPNSADWAAMEKMIQSDPFVNTPKKNKSSGWFASWVALAVVLISVPAFLFWPSGETAPGHIQESMQRMEDHKETPSASDKAVAEEVGEKDYSDNQQSSEANIEGSDDFANQEALDENESVSASKHAKEELAPSKNISGGVSPSATGRSGKATPTSVEEQTSKDESNKDLAKAEPTVSESPSSAKAEENISSSLVMDQNDLPVSKEAPLENAAANLDGKTFAKQQLLHLPFPTLFEAADRGSKKKSIDNVKLSPESSADDEMDIRSTGFRLSGVNAAAAYSAGFRSGFSAFGYGADVDVRRGKWVINTGFYKFDFSYEEPRAQSRRRLDVDTTFLSHVETRDMHYVDSLWIVQGPYQGGYVYDTVRYQVFDTIVEMQIDSSAVNINYTENQKTRISYVEIPALIGYRFQKNRLAWELSGGAIFGKSTSVTGEGPEPETSLGIDLVFRPGIRYYLVPRFSVFGRGGMRYGIVSDGFREENFRYDLQFGVGYHF